MKSTKISALILALLLTVQISGVPTTMAEMNFFPEKIVTCPDFVYGISDRDGFLVSIDGGTTYEQRNLGLPTKVVYPFDTTEYRLLTALAVDPTNSRRVAVTTPQKLFISEDSGQNWREIPLNTGSFGNAYFTSVALSGNDKNRIALGTSFVGLFETLNGGKTWLNYTKKIPLLYKGAGFYEEISALAYYPKNKDELYFACGYGNGVYCYNSLSSSHRSLPAFDDLRPGVSSMYFGQNPRLNNDKTNPWCLTIQNGDKLLTYNDKEHRLLQTESLSRLPLAREKEQRLETAEERTGIYLRSDFATGSRLESKINFLKQNKLKTIVYDFKDDFGNLTYDSKIPLAREIGAVHPRVDVKAFLKRMKEEGIYVIARIVTFKDERMYYYNNGANALWDSKTNKPWKNLLLRTDPETKEKKYIQGEFWLDPYSEQVWDYNIDIAEELQALGVDEIQFDYIRFPTDGNLTTAKYRHRRAGMEKTDALESFLRKARAKIDLPISTDLYGFNCWYRMNHWTGQDLEIFSQYIDVVCPMFYPSHFPSNFMKGYTYAERASQIYFEGTARSHNIAEQRLLVRPYVQAFLLGNESKMTAPSYTNYLNKQIEGIFKSGEGSGYLLWNNSNNYYMVNPAMPNISDEGDSKQP